MTEGSARAGRAEGRESEEAGDCRADERQMACNEDLVARLGQTCLPARAQPARKGLGWRSLGLRRDPRLLVSRDSVAGGQVPPIRFLFGATDGATFTFLDILMCN